MNWPALPPGVRRQSHRSETATFTLVGLHLES